MYRQKNCFKTYEEAQKQIGRFIQFYNSRRPHYSIGLQTPDAVHEQRGELSKMWKNKTTAHMCRVLRLIPNFVQGIWTEALWRRCASSRWADYLSVFHNTWLCLYECQLLQEKVNHIKNTINDLSKMVVNRTKN